MGILLISAILALGANAYEFEYDMLPQGFVPRYPKNIELLRTETGPSRYPKHMEQLRSEMGLTEEDRIDRPIFTDDNPPPFLPIDNRQDNPPPIQSKATTGCDCGKSKHGHGSCDGIGERIVNGDYAHQGQYPWQVALTLCAGRRCFACGGTIINHKYVITAMHCVTDPDGQPIPAYGISVGVGEHNKQSYPPAFFKKVGVVNVIRRIDYDPVAMDNDIAILELSEWLFFNDDVKPACLPSSIMQTYGGWHGVVSGWGATSYQGTSSAILKRIGMRILYNSDENCVRGALGWGAPGSQKLCAENYNGDSCQGDSGGPLVTVEDDRCTLIGVVSYGHKCAIAGYAGIYARVTNYLRWILQHTQDGGCGFAFLL